MNLLVLRKRILNFRLTEYEYQSLQKASQENGARSISDYARAVLLGPLPPEETRNPSGDLLRRLNDLETRLSALTDTIQQPRDPATEKTSSAQGK